MTSHNFSPVVVIPNTCEEARNSSCGRETDRSNLKANRNTSWHYLAGPYY